MALDWARAAQGCQLHHQSCDPLDSRGKAEAWLTEENLVKNCGDNLAKNCGDNLAKNCGSGTEEHEPQLGHHPEAGQRQAGVEELHCCLIRQLA